MENKDSVEFQSRKFKISLSGVAVPDAAQLNGGHFTWNIPPPSDLAFSDKYRSCLILLRSVDIMNIAGVRVHTAAGQITGQGFNPVWISSGVVVPVVQDPSAGIIVETDLPCKQHATAQFATAPLVVGGSTGQTGSGRYSKTIPNACNFLSNLGASAADQNLTLEGAQEFRIAGVNAIAAAHQGVLIQRRPIWSWRTDADILDEGLLGATPFGRDLTVTLKDAITNNEIWLKSAGIVGGAANIQHQQTAICCEFEFLMMP